MYFAVAALLIFPCAGLMWLLARWVIKNPRSMGDWDFVKVNVTRGNSSRRGEIVTWAAAGMLIVVPFSRNHPEPLMVALAIVGGYAVFAYGLFYWCGANIKEIGKVLGLHLAIMGAVVAVYGLILWYAASHFEQFVG